MPPTPATPPDAPASGRRISWKEIRRELPGWLTSLGFHATLLAILALVATSQPFQERTDRLQVELSGGPAGRFIGTALPDGGDAPGPVEISSRAPGASGGAPQEAVTPPADPAVPANTSNEAPTETRIEPTGPPTSSDSSVPRRPSQVSVGGALGGRGRGGRGRGGGGSGGGGGGLGGGTGETERAVELGLLWLAAMQKQDGHWQLHRRDGKSDSDPGYPDGGTVQTSTGATALALLPFLGAGHTHKEGNHTRTVRRGLDWLVRQQKSNGDLHDWDDLGRPSSFYAHGQATIVLCEAYALTKDPTLREPARKAIAYLCESQHPVTGGWKYRPHSDGDMSVFGWQIMALESARMGGIEVPEEVLDRAAGFLDRVQEQGGARYKYEPDSPAARITPAMTAEGLLCRQYLGWPRSHPALLEGIGYLMQPEHLPQWSAGRRNVYGWYYATQVLHNLEGPAWENWNRALQGALVGSQVRTGRMAGSWSPTVPASDPLEHSAPGGRLYVTSLCLLSLEVYYRYLPLYRSAEESTKAKRE